MMSLDFVLFDLYGTLLDVEIDEDRLAAWEALTQDLTERGARISPERLRQMFFLTLNDLRKDQPDGFVMEEVIYRVLNRLIGPPDRSEVFRFGAMFRYLTAQCIELRSYTVPLIQGLRSSGCRIGLVSNTEAVLTRPDLHRFPIMNELEVIILSSEIGIKKPDHRIFDEAIRRIESTPDRGAFVGDNFEEDIVGAIEAGLAAVFLTKGGEVPTLHDSPRLLTATPDLAEIASALEQLGWYGSFSDQRVTP